MDELLDLFDRNGRLVGQTVRHPGEKPQTPAGCYWRVCDVWFVRPNGDILSQRRAMDKQPWPGMWSNSAGGSIRSGETPEQGCIRETQEELGVTPDPDRGCLAFEFLTENAIHDVWVFWMDVSPEKLVLQKEEVMDAGYFPPGELRRMMRSGEMVPIGYLDQLLAMLPILGSAYRQPESRKEDTHAESL